MAKPILYYELSSEADKDLQEIFDYTVKMFGLEQAIAYVSSFDALFAHLCENPKLGRERNEIEKDLRSIVKDRYVVLYSVVKTCIQIVRVLHASRDVTKFTPPME